MLRSHVGEFEELVLMAVAALEGSGYGLAVRDLIHEQTGRRVSLGAIHATLYRLQEKNMLSSTLEGATETRGGRRKRMFTLSSAGLEAIRSAREARDRMWNLVPPEFKPETAG